MTEELSGGSRAASQQLVCAGILSMPISYMVVGAALRFGGVLPDQGFADLDGQTSLLLTAALLVASVSAAVFSLFFKKMILAAGGDPASQEQRFKAVLVSMALSESGAVMGLALLLLTGNLLYGALLCGLSFAITCFHFPGRHWLTHGDDAI